MLSWDFFEGINGASVVVIDWIMKLAPVAVFALIAPIVAQFGLDLLRSLLVYALVVVAGLLLHVLFTTQVALRFFAKIKPRTFYSRVSSVPLVAFSTSSSSATLPLTMENCRRKPRSFKVCFKFRSSSRGND